MVAAYPMARISFGGALGAGEEWQCSLKLGLSGTLTQDGLQDLVDSASGYVTDWWEAGIAQRFFGDQDNLSFVTAYLIPAGLTRAERVAHAVRTPAPGTGSQIHPNQVSCVVSLLSSDPSRRGRGRIYLPSLVFAGPVMDNTTVSAAASATAGLINALNTLSDVGVMAGSSAGSRVTTVRVDNKFDTQRRRQEGSVASIVATADITA